MCWLAARKVPGSPGWTAAPLKTHQAAAPGWKHRGFGEPWTLELRRHQSLSLGTSFQWVQPSRDQVHAGRTHTAAQTFSAPGRVHASLHTRTTHSTARTHTPGPRSNTTPACLHLHTSQRRTLLLKCHTPTAYAHTPRAPPNRNTATPCHTSLKGPIHLGHACNAAPHTLIHPVTRSHMR